MSRTANVIILIAILLLVLMCTGGKVRAEAPTIDPTYGVAMDSNPSISIWEQEAFILRLQKQINQLPEENLIKTADDLINWTNEILPFYAYEHLVDYDEARGPSDVYFKWNAGDRNFHVLGSAQCHADGKDQGVVMINGRGANPVSNWYGREDTIFTLIHELQHMQGGTFCDGLSEDLESNTQLGAVEIASAMVNSGHTELIRPLLEELRDMGLSALEYSAPLHYYDFYAKVFKNDPIRMARLDRSLRHWANDPYGLKDILYKYNKVPFDAIMTGLRTGSIARVEVRDAVQTLPPSETLVVHQEKFDDAQYLLAYPTLENLVEASNAGNP